MSVGNLWGFQLDSAKCFNSSAFKLHRQQEMLTMQLKAHYIIMYNVKIKFYYLYIYGISYLTYLGVNGTLKQLSIQIEIFWSSGLTTNIEIDMKIDIFVWERHRYQLNANTL